MIGLDSDNVDGDYDRLKAAGAEFIEQPTDYGGLRIATLKDPRREHHSVVAAGVAG
jgi:hypothetical protein